MELRTIAGRLRAGDTFKLVAIGYAVGMGVIFVPLLLLVLLLAGTSGVAPGEGDAGGPGPLHWLMPIVMLPFIIVIQSLIMGGMVTLGLWLYQTRRPIRVVTDDAVPPA